MSIPEDFMTIKEFAALIRVHANTVRRLIKTGKLSAFRIGIGPKSGYRISSTETHRMAVTDLEKIVDALIDKRL